MRLRIATFNVNNLFRRARLFESAAFTPEGKKVLVDIQRLQELMAKDVYTAADKKAMVTILDRYKIGDAGQKKWFDVEEVRPDFFVKRKNPKRTEIVANGRADWLGGIKLTMEDVDDRAIDNTAGVIEAVKAHIMCIVEVESRPTLVGFNETSLAAEKYEHAMVIDGNDERGIDVGLLSRYPIASMTSHVDDTYQSQNGPQKIFSRDCAEYIISLNAGKQVAVLCNHFKSKGYGSQASNDQKRERQVQRVCEILAQKFDLTKDFVVVAGDLNDNPGPGPLQKLLTLPNLHDVLASPKLGGPRWTYHDKKSSFDYLLVSTTLHNKLQAVGIERSGFLFDVPGLKKADRERQRASDHAAVWAEFDV